MNRRCWLIVMSTLFTAVLVTAGCDKIKGLTEKDKDRYVNKDLGVRFKIPQGWPVDARTKQEDGRSKLLAAYTREPNVGIKVDYSEIDLKKVSFQGWVRGLAASFSQQWENLSVSGEPKELVLNGRPAMEMVVTGVVPPHPRALILSYFVADEAKNRVYNLLFFSPVERYDALVRDFMELVNSFEIK